MYRRYALRIIMVLSVAGGLALASAFMVFKEKQDRCWASIGEKVSKSNDLTAVLHQEIGEFQLLVEESLVARTKILSVINSLREKNDKPLSSRELETLRTGTVLYLGLRSRLYDMAERYECALEVNEHYLRLKRIDPVLQVKAVLLSLGAALTLNDNWVLAAAAFVNEPQLRRLIDLPDSGFGISSASLSSMADTANSLFMRERVRRGLRFFERKYGKTRRFVSASSAASKTDDDLDYLVLLIKNSPSYSIIRERQAGRFVALQLDAAGRMAGDFLHELGRDGLDRLSGFFGNTVGLVEVRKGKLYGKKEAAGDLLSLLKPLDILVEKTPFRLTDKCIPGHFGHAAIWIGTEAELRHAGVWDSPVVAPHHAKLAGVPDEYGRGPALIIEALRGGVQLSTLERFLNVDDVAVLRPVSVTMHPDAAQRRELTQEALLLAFRQLGKDYDFNFDVNTTDKIVCSELIYVSYPSIAWPTEHVVGRFTISPDNVARLAAGGAPLHLVRFYHDGELVAGAAAEERFNYFVQPAMMEAGQ